MAPTIAYDHGRILRIESGGGVVELGPDDDPMAIDDDLGLPGEHWDPEVVEGEQVRVLSMIYLDLECNTILGTYDLDADMGKPYYFTILGRPKTLDKDVLQTEIFKVLAHRLDQWKALYGQGWPVSWLEQGPGWSVTPEDMPVPPGLDFKPLPLYEEQQVDHLPGARATTNTAKAINGRTASATVAAIAANDAKHGLADANGLSKRRFGVVSGKSGVPRRMAKTEKEKEREDRSHKKMAEAYALYFLEKHGQLAARDFLIELDMTVRQKCRDRGLDVPAHVDELKKTESTHCAEALLMSVKKARAIWRRSTLYPALKKE
ncbi:MAG: hypothetical protein EHM35_04565 [Planctomycetaceae bacterium]|nr:MAG: hypothetical protein EHM35_04565 [Planctomycetaceae bacterium]